MAIITAAGFFMNGCVPLTLGTITGALPISQADDALARNDLKTAAAKYLEAAKAGHPRAQYKVGMMYTQGKGLPKDVKTSVEWMKKSAEAGYAPAQFTYGYWLLCGKNVKADQPQAVAWLTKAAAQEDGEAAFFLGTMYAAGLAVPRDRNEAIRWFRVAKAQGFPISDEVLATGDPTQDPDFRRGGSKKKKK
ncbi:MAG: tetratricopeptide repeat protein [Thermodesulfobacteriota bacterium]